MIDWNEEEKVLKTLMIIIFIQLQLNISKLQILNISIHTFAFYQSLIIRIRFTQTHLLDNNSNTRNSRRLCRWRPSVADEIVNKSEMKGRFWSSKLDGVLPLTPFANVRPFFSLKFIIMTDTEACIHKHMRLLDKERNRGGGAVL